MKTAALLLCLLALGACEKRPGDPKTPSVDAVAGVGTLPAVPSSPDPSVPSATEVFTTAPASTAKDEVAAKLSSNDTLTRTQESNTMPMPGQVNNHSSTSLDPANTRRAASAP